MGMIRSFVAVPVKGLSEIEHLAEALGRIRGIKGVRTENIHLTLRFLGNIDEEQEVQRICERLQEVADRHGAIEVRFRGTGAFPNPSRMKVAWIGIDSPELVLLARDVMAALPVKKGERSQSFKAHLTIGRVKFADGIHTARKTLERYQDHDFGSLEVHEFHLMKSTLTPQGPIYDRLASFPLTGTTAI